MEKYFTCDEIAEKFGVKKLTVWSWIREKKLNAIRTGRIYSIRPQDVAEFENARMTRNC
jgi:excisionase family DNA binding protein